MYKCASCTYACTYAFTYRHVRVYHCIRFTRPIIHVCWIAGDSLVWPGIFNAPWPIVSLVLRNKSMMMQTLMISPLFSLCFLLITLNQTCSQETCVIVMAVLAPRAQPRESGYDARKQSQYWSSRPFLTTRETLVASCHYKADRLTRLLVGDIAWSKVRHDNTSFVSNKTRKNDRTAALCRVPWSSTAVGAAAHIPRRRSWPRIYMNCHIRNKSQWLACMWV